MAKFRFPYKPAKAPPHQKAGAGYLFELTLPRIAATPRRAFVRGLLAKIAYDNYDKFFPKGVSTYDEYKAKRLKLGRGMLPPIAAKVREELPGKYPTELKKASFSAFQEKRKKKHEMAKAAIERGKAAAKELGVAFPG